MITISLCMIVKNEEKVLKRCLDSIADLVDELIIVDTGSKDNTVKIVKDYPTAKLFHFTWIGDFSAARNYAFAQATKDYIYSADADEVLDDENRERFLKMKECLLPEIEIVQMKYGNQLQYNTLYNFDEEYRPKLFKRIRTFTWEAPIHETVKIAPVIYDSDIVITHLPQNSHAKRDIEAFENMVRKGTPITKRLLIMYAKELYISGAKQDKMNAGSFFQQVSEDIERDEEEIMDACLLAAIAARLQNDMQTFFKYSMKVMGSGGCAEFCKELGDYYLDMEDYKEASIWYYNAYYETEPILCLQVKGKDTLLKLAECFMKLGHSEEAEKYVKEAEKLK